MTHAVQEKACKGFKLKRRLKGGWAGITEECELLRDDAGDAGVTPEVCRRAYTVADGLRAAGLPAPVGLCHRSDAIKLNWGHAGLTVVVTATDVTFTVDGVYDSAPLEWVDEQLSTGDTP